MKSKNEQKTGAAKGSQEDVSSKNQDAMHARNVAIRLSAVLVFLLCAVAVFVYAGRNQAKIDSQFQKSELPAGMPMIAPIPKSIVKIDPTKNKIEDYTYSIQGDTPGEMKNGKMYTIEGVSDKTPTEIRDFYNKLLLDKGYRQRINISLPSGHRLDLENEKNIFSLEVERKKTAKETTVKIVIYD
jgi:hypothetical protein